MCQQTERNLTPSTSVPPGLRPTPESADHGSPSRGPIAARAGVGSGMASLTSIAMGIATFMSVAIVRALYQRRAFTAPRTLRTARFPSPATGRIPHHH